MTAILADSVESFGDLSHTVWLFGCACQEVEPSRLNWEFSDSRVRDQAGEFLRDARSLHVPSVL